MRRAANNRSIPVDIVRDDPELAKVFAGMAVYNHGRITVAYKVGVAFDLKIDYGNPRGVERLMVQPFAISRGARLTFDTIQLLDDPIDADSNENKRLR